MEKVIEIKGLYKSYYQGKQEVQILKDVSLDIHKGDFVAILGPSGSGKSTLMNILGGIDTLDQGEYKFNNTSVEMKEDLSKMRNDHIGFIFQKFNLISKYSALYNVALPAIIQGKGRKDAYEQGYKMLGKVGLAERVNHKPVELSGGQQQRVAIARALINEPELVLADEPTGNLDSKSSDAIMGLLQQLHRKGHTIVMITHDLEVAKKAERIIHVKDGRIVA
ncbi:ABC transporter ATP-binding protein [Vallitalea okinawensis]|uniref:ABC transporter ATP-binding protein n=1 Tax=Vallitalea okinawensis TaxID=2078660 RepID=UPI000CFA8C68|nr:ABC transporter ATP-binding protein [Vallitalea okinawensis]